MDIILPSKNFLTVRICHPTVKTVNSPQWCCVRPHTCSPAHVRDTCLQTWPLSSHEEQQTWQKAELRARSLLVSSIIWNWFGYNKSDVEHTSVICRLKKKKQTPSQMKIGAFALSILYDKQSKQWKELTSIFTFQTFLIWVITVLQYRWLGIF